MNASSHLKVVSSTGTVRGYDVKAARAQQQQDSPHKKEDAELRLSSRGRFIHEVPTQTDYGQLIDEAKDGRGDFSEDERYFLKVLSDEPRYDRRFEDEGLFFVNDEVLNDSRLGAGNFIKIVKGLFSKHGASNIKIGDESRMYSLVLRPDELKDAVTLWFTAGSNLDKNCKLIPEAPPGSSSGIRDFFLDLSNASLVADDPNAELAIGFVENADLLSNNTEYEELFSATKDRHERGRGVILASPFPEDPEAKFPRISAEGDFRKSNPQNDEIVDDELGITAHNEEMQEMVLSYLTPTTPLPILDAAEHFKYSYRPYDKPQNSDYGLKYGMVFMEPEPGFSAGDYGFGLPGDIIEHIRRRLPLEFNYRRK